MEQLDLNQVRSFVQLVQAGSFTKAAAVLRQPKSRISRRLAALEKELGAQLIFRTTRQFQLTEVGRNYYERAKGLVEGLESLATEVSEARSEISGLIRLTASDDMGMRLLPTILDDFTKHYPQVRFELILTQAYIDLVKESIDAGIRIGHLKDSSLKVRKVGVVRNIFVATPGFLERYRHHDDINELGNLPFVAMTMIKKIEFVKGAEVRRLDLKVDPMFTSNNPAMLLEIALLGKGVAFLPEFLCREPIRTGRLIHLHKSYQGSEVPVHLVSPDQKETSLKVKKFLEFLAKRLKEILAQG